MGVMGFRAGLGATDERPDMRLALGFLTFGLPLHKAISSTLFWRPSIKGEMVSAKGAIDTAVETIDQSP
jgi:hypothetical protein